jgi:hypothetical protein
MRNLSRHNDLFEIFILLLVSLSCSQPDQDRAMGTQMEPETSVIFNHLTLPTAIGDFI